MKKETKQIKRIGWITYIDQKKLRQYLGWQNLFDLKQYTLEKRYEILRHLEVLQKQEAFENITPTVGFAMIASALAGENPGISPVNVHAFGTGETAPVAGDTQLETETTRATLSTTSFNGNKAFYTAFYDLADAVGTHTEMGLFAGADPNTPDDGTLWDRSIIDITKTAQQSLTIDYEDEFVNN